MIPDSNTTITHAREHAWKYFELHARQRIAVFNFFLVLSGALAAGIAATLQGSSRFASLGIGLGVLLVMVSFVFWKLDQRVSFLIKHAEAGLKQIEGMFPTPAAQLFQQEPEKTIEAQGSANAWSRMWTYGVAFRVIFFAMGITGALGALLCTLRFSGQIQW